MNAMVSVWISLFFSAGTFSLSLAASAADHCSAACESCDSKLPVCVVIPQTAQFPCLCKLHSAMCKGFAENVVFHKGDCLSQKSKSSGDVSLLTFLKDGSPVNLQTHGKKISLKEKSISKLLGGSASGNLPINFNPPVATEDTDNLKKIRKVRGLGNQYNSRYQRRLCNLFYNSDRNNADENNYRKHFQCKTADISKTEIL